MLKMRVSKQIIDIFASDPNGDEKDPPGEAHGDVSNRSDHSLFAEVYARVERRVIQACYLRTHEVAMRVTAAMSGLGSAFMEVVTRDDVALRAHRKCPYKTGMEQGKQSVRMQTMPCHGRDNRRRTTHRRREQWQR